MKWIKLFVKRCPACQLICRIKIPIKARKYTLSASGLLMNDLNGDFIGPFTVDDEGYMYIFVIIDCFSRWIELYATRTTTAKEAAECLIQHYGRFGVASFFRTDNGPGFNSEIIKELILLGGAEMEYSTAYSHQENAIVERANKEVLRHLRAIVFDKRRTGYVKHDLPFIQRIMNTLEKKSIGITAAEILFPSNHNLTNKILSKSHFDNLKKFI